MRLLIIEDDEKLSKLLKRGLDEAGYASDQVYDGIDGENYAKQNVYDLIILDIMLPKKNGFDLCKTIRDENIQTPILMLTAKDTIEDKVKGLNTGADDYLIKPFHFDELLARIRALLRRRSSNRSPKLKAGDLIMDTLTKEVLWKNQSIELTTKEFTILEYFLINRNILLSRRMIEEHIWNYDFDCESNIIDVYIRRIRNKIDPMLGKEIIKTIRGAGYQLIL